MVQQMKQKGKNVLYRQWNQPFSYRLYAMRRYHIEDTMLMLQEEPPSVYVPSVKEIEDFLAGYVWIVHVRLPIDPQTRLPKTSEPRNISLFWTFSLAFDGTSLLFSKGTYSTFLATTVH